MSDSDDSSIMEYLPNKSTTKKKTLTSAASQASKKKKTPSISYTGSSQQPMSLDDDSDASSELEILPPARTKTAPKKAPPAKAKKSMLDSSDDSDSDDSFFDPLPKESKKSTVDKQSVQKREQERKKAEQERKKQDKLAAKQAEQARKKADRQAKKEQKEFDKQVEKETRKRQRKQQQQARGNFAKEEIVLLVDPSLFRRPKDHGCYDWRDHEEIKTHNCSVQEYPSALGSGTKCHALQWIRRDYLKGGAKEAWEQLRKNNHEGYTHLDRLVIVIDDPKEFIDLLRRSPEDAHDDDDYPKLREWLIRLEHCWKAAWPQATAKRPTVLLLLNQVENEVDRQRSKNSNRHNREEATNKPPSSEDFHDAMTWMLIQFQVECMDCAGYEAIWTHVLKHTRALAMAPYQQAMTELECIKRMRPMYEDNDTPLTKAKDTWLRQLQQIPGVSEAKARKLVLHYPTIQSLWQAYNDPDTENPEELAAGCLSNRYEQKLGEHIYKLLNSTNPEEILN